MNAIGDMLRRIIAEQDAEDLAAMNNNECPSFPINPDAVIRRQEAQRMENALTLSDFDGDCTAAIKMRLSGLSDRSLGNGTDRHTVIHAIAIAQISKGRFLRQPRQFLCTTKGAKEYGVGAAVGCQVDCQPCKDIIQRHGLSVVQVNQLLLETRKHNLSDHNWRPKREQEDSDERVWRVCFRN